MTAAEIEQLGYFQPKMLDTGEWAACHEYLYTTGICVGLDEVGYRTRFCYPTALDAIRALLAWDGNGDPSGPWIKEKGDRGERSNLAQNFKGIPVITEKP